jgi:hypothetical protein
VIPSNAYWNLGCCSCRPEPAAVVGQYPLSLGLRMCHCEERSDEAIPQCAGKRRDCFASLAMTRHDVRPRLRVRWTRRSLTVPATGDTI